MIKPHSIKLVVLLVGLIFVIPSTIVAQTNWREGAGHLKLKNSLDRPEDGYCLDVVGSGQYLRFDLPLNAHNCKPGLYADEAVKMESDGTIRFPAYNRCATVSGLNGRALPGAAVVPAGCGENTPFLDTKGLQSFTQHKDGKLELTGTDLCLTVGRESDRTFSPDHRWRPLFVERCGEAVPERSQWEFVPYR
jgi:hypothetical protein